MLNLPNKNAGLMQQRRPRISLPNGLTVAWHGGGGVQVSRVKTLGSGGLFLSAPIAPPVGASLTLVLEVP